MKAKKQQRALVGGLRVARKTLAKKAGAKRAKRGEAWGDPFIRPSGEGWEIILPAGQGARYRVFFETRAEAESMFRMPEPERTALCKRLGHWSEDGFDDEAPSVKSSRTGRMRSQRGMIVGAPLPSRGGSECNGSNGRVTVLQLSPSSEGPPRVCAVGGGGAEVPFSKIMNYGGSPEAQASAAQPPLPPRGAREAAELLSEARIDSEEPLLDRMIREENEAIEAALKKENEENRAVLREVIDGLRAQVRVLERELLAALRRESREAVGKEGSPSD